MFNMYDLNRATILGRLTRDPELRTTTTGKSVASVGVATGRSWTDQAGTKHEETEFHNCVLWGKLAEIAGQYLTKGKQVYFEGRLQTHEWTAQDGTPRKRTEIIVENMIMLGGPRGAAGAAGAGVPAAAPSAPAGTAGEPSYIPTDPVSPPKDEDIKVEDIPF